MKRSIQNFVIDTIAFISFILLTTTGIVMRYLLPAGSRRFKAIWGMDRHEWGAIHFWISVVFLCCLTMHLFLHWRWIIAIVTGKSREGAKPRLGLGIIGVCGIIALAVSPLLSPIETTINKESECAVCSTRDHEKIQVMGYMTLQEVARNSKVPIEYIIRELNLPAGIEVTENLGKLRKQFGFEIEDVRRFICNYKRNNQK